MLVSSPENNPPPLPYRLPSCPPPPPYPPPDRPAAPPRHPAAAPGGPRRGEEGIRTQGTRTIQNRGARAAPTGHGGGGSSPASVASVLSCAVPTVFFSPAQLPSYGRGSLLARATGAELCPVSGTVWVAGCRVGGSRIGRRELVGDGAVAAVPVRVGVQRRGAIGTRWVLFVGEIRSSPVLVSSDHSKTNSTVGRRGRDHSVLTACSSWGWGMHRGGSVLGQRALISWLLPAYRCMVSAQLAAQLGFF